MKENKRLFYFAIIISILSLGISIYLNFKVKTEVAIYISGIMLNIFAGSIILVGTSLIYYFSERRKLFHSIMNQCLLLRNTFNDIEYLEDISYCSFEEYYEYYKKVRESKSHHRHQPYRSTTQSSRLYAPSLLSPSPACANWR